MRVVIVAVLILVVLGAQSCGGSCGLQLKQRLCFPAFRMPPDSCDWPSANLPEIPCCGASLHQDLNLTADDVQVDVVNSSGMNGRVDVFVADGECTNLFTAPYNGAALSSACTIQVGPVAPAFRVSDSHFAAASIESSNRPTRRIRSRCDS